MSIAILKPEAERIHHPYSPSSLQSRELCPKYKPKNTATQAAIEGTRQHNVAESGIDDDRLKDFKAAAVVECMKFVDDRLRQYPGGSLIREEYLPIDENIVRARTGLRKMLLDPMDPDPEIVEDEVIENFLGTTAGYLDVGILSADKTECEIIDFKFGKVPVEPAENNVQGMAYLLGLRKRYPKIKKGRVWFLMPHLDLISYHDFTENDFGQLELRIKVIVSRAIEAHKDENDFSMATPNISACLFCALLGKCPKVAEHALKLGQKYAPLRIPDSVSTTVFTDPADVERGLKFAQVIKEWAEAYRAQATAKTLDDMEFCPKGYVVQIQSRRTVKNARKLADLAKTFLPEELRPKVEELFDVSIGDLEDIISLSAARGQKEKTVESFGKSALEAGHLEEGQPFAFLRQDTTGRSRKPKESKQ